jgi:hypothetical protein
MSGFEHQAASHMMAEGLVLESLAITRAIHDRYHASRRNPYNEVECSDHYARAMASYGTFITACGFESHGPTSRICFAPRLTPESFRAPFTIAGGWGTYEQKRAPGKQSHSLEIKHGQTTLKTLVVELAPDSTARHVNARLGGKTVPATLAQNEATVDVTFDEKLTLVPGRKLQVELAW